MTEISCFSTRCLGSTSFWINTNLSDRFWVDSNDIRLVPVSLTTRSFSNLPSTDRGLIVMESFSSLWIAPCCQDGWKVIGRVEGLRYQHYSRQDQNSKRLHGQFPFDDVIFKDICNREHGAKLTPIVTGLSASREVMRISARRRRTLGPWIGFTEKVVRSCM
jgi:hypothetical protein